MHCLYDQPGIFAIHIAGQLDSSWSEILGGLKIACAVNEGEDGQPVSVLYGSLPDQAGLFGVLDTLYNARYPILFVRYLRRG